METAATAWPLCGHPDGNSVFFPEDLREWVDGERLGDLVASVVHQLANPDSRPAAAVLAYAYSIGVYGSEEIVVSGGSSFPREIAESGGPVWTFESLRQFRRCHRSLIQGCLDEVLEKVWKSRGRFQGETFSRSQDFHIESARRINESVRLDCWVADC